MLISRKFECFTELIDFTEYFSKDNEFIYWKQKFRQINYLFSNFIGKTIAFTKFLRKMCGIIPAIFHNVHHSIVLQKLLETNELELTMWAAFTEYFLSQMEYYVTYKYCQRWGHFKRSKYSSAYRFGFSVVVVSKWSFAQVYRIKTQYVSVCVSKCQ